MAAISTVSAVALANLVTMTTRLSDMIAVVHRLTAPLRVLGLPSRALELAIDEENMTVRVVYEHRVKMALAMGNADRLEDGNTWIGSGASKLSVEATPAGDEVWSAAIDAGYQSRSLAYPALWVYPDE